MSAFEWGILMMLGAIALPLWGILSVLEKKTNRQLSNIADRLLDIRNDFDNRRF